jgi:hypothetical protein
MRIAGVLFLVLLVVAAPLAAADGPARSDKPLRFVLSGAVVGLGVADTATTIYGCKRGLVETNGLMAGLVERHHWAALWTAQAIGTGIVVLACNVLVHNKPTRVIGYAVFAAVILARSYVVWHNARLNRGLS